MKIIKTKTLKNKWRRKFVNQTKIKQKPLPLNMGENLFLQKAKIFSNNYILFKVKTLLFDDGIVLTELISII